MLVNRGYKVHTCPKTSQRTSANRLHEKRKSASQSSYPVEFPFSEHKQRRYSMVSFWDLTDKISPAESVAATSGKSFFLNLQLLVFVPGSAYLLLLRSN